MAFFEFQFDPRFSYGARGGPTWRTTKVMTRSGRRFVDREWEYPLHRYNVSHAVKTNDDFEAVRAFFYNVAGSYDGFRFKDWSDYEATQANSKLTALGTSPETWQLQRKYVTGTRTFLRDITKPRAGVAVYRTRASVVTLATATVDITNGTASIEDHVPGDTYAWVGEFDVPVAFAMDEMEAEIVDQGDDEYLVRWGSIVVEEIRT